MKKLIIKKRIAIKLISYSTIFLSVPILISGIIWSIILSKIYLISLNVLIIALFSSILLWFSGVLIYFILLRYKFMFLIGKLFLKTYDIKNKEQGDYNAESKKMVAELNKITTLVQESETKVNKENIKDIYETEVINKTKELQKEIENIKSYNNQITEVFMSLTHDIKNPLNVIGGYASTILRYENNFSVDKKRDFLKRIVNETDRLSRMIKNFLNTLSEERDLNKMTFNKVNIELILNYFYNMYEVKAKEREINFILDINTPIPFVWGNYEKLEFVVSNLLSNAFKFVTSKGKIVIKADLQKPYVKVSISNTGPPINKNKEKYIFKKFEKIPYPNTENEGTGLGLYIAKEIIEKHNGEIGIENNRKNRESTTLYFKVPITKL